MVTPKTKKKHDIDISNRIADYLRPYLFSDEKITPFVIKRAINQANEIEDFSIKNSTLSMAYFSAHDTNKGIEYAEEALSCSPNDVVTWKHYMLGVFWRCGPQQALGVVQRARKYVVSYEIMRNGMFYAFQVSDYALALELYNELEKSEKIDELIHHENEKEILEQALKCAGVAGKYNKTDTIKNLSKLMFKMLSQSQKQNSFPHIIDVSGIDDGVSIIFEVHLLDTHSKKCAEMTRQLISLRVEAGLLDWDVGCMFVSKYQGDTTDACHA